MQFRRLTILMWKHCMVRMRRFIHTPIEILSPIIFILVLFSFKDKIKPVRPGTLTDNDDREIRYTDELQLHQLPSARRVLYSPDTAFTSSLMDSVGNQLKLKKLTASELQTATKGYYGFNNYTEIVYWLEKLSNTDAVVLFDDLTDKEDAPNHLSYTVRMKGSYFTNEIYARDGAAKPHSEFGSDYYRFMRLQWAIDTSFIKILTGANITQRLSVQEFPSVGRGSDTESVMELVCSLLPPLCWLSLFLVFVFLMARLLEERSTGIQELVKIVGVSSNLFGISHFLNSLPAGLVYSVGSTVLLKVTSVPLVDSDGLVIFVVLALHYLSVVAMAFPCSYITQSTQYTVSLSVFVYVALWMPARFLSEYTVSGFTLVSGLLPHVPVQWLWKEIAAREQYGEVLSISDSFKSHSASSGPVALGVLFLAIQTVVMFALAWYLARVRPGQYGQALPWNFLLQKQYWTKNEVKPKPDSETEEEVPIAREQKYFEETPKNMQTGIKIENVSKVFPKHVALNNVSLDAYRGEITVLLGHNGAGKTTLMSIITGMMSASEGRVLVGGADARAGDAARAHVGLCPQHNLFFADLTVLEHVMFFTLIKGGTFKNAREKSYELLDKLGLREKAHQHSSALSGGMKRRLQLACALAGDADVLVLDEPTSGLDVETRRELWNLLLSLRGDRTVLLTTHFMEEADALGDRVAALHLGQLRCYATTMFLKKAIGTGYRLTFTTRGRPREAAVTAAVTSHVREATLKEQTINSLSYNLPAAASGHFPGLFSSLEERRSELGIETIGVGVSTLEEVFLKLCSDTDTSFTQDEVDNAQTEPISERVTGPVLWCRQVRVLMRRQFKYLWMKKTSFLALQLVLPIIMICVFTNTTNNAASSASVDRVPVDMELFAALPERRVLCDVTSDVRLRALNDAWPKVDFREEKNLTAAVIRASEADATDYRKFIAGIEISDTHLKALYTTTVRHAAPVSVNLLTNALATRHVSYADGRTLRTRFDPVPSRGPAAVHDALVRPKDMGLAITYSLFIVFIILSTNVYAVSLPCKERASGARHIHMMSGCAAALHWASKAAFDIAVCAVFLVSAVAAAAVALDRDSTINNASVVMSLALVLVVGSLAFFSLMYFVSCFFQERVAGLVLVASLVVFGIVTTSIAAVNEFLNDVDSSKSAFSSFGDFIIKLCSYTMPPHAATIAFVKCLFSARYNAYCELNRHRCPLLAVPEPGFDTEKCCAGENPRCYMCLDNTAPGKELLVLTAQFFFFMSLVILTQMGVFNRIHDRIFNGWYRNSTRKTETGDEIVRAEAIYVKKQIDLPREKIQESGQAMLVSDLHKNYFHLLGKSCNAVKGISFSVKKGECFGLLGVNGAGKSTTFKMLTAEECPTKGDIYGNGFFGHERRQYLQSLGYCPQFFGLDDFQTGRENLELILTLRGHDAADVRREVTSWIQVVGLEKYSEREVAGYSGGCTRRLAAAAALCSGAPLTLLDEPTAGVDVSARRRVWRALQRGLAQGRAVIITSHSMDEMEALCSRIAIMSGGVIRAVGTPSELRAHHAAGHAVHIKVAHAPVADEVDGGSKPSLEQLKGMLQSKFNCTLKDEHKTMLHYHINETMRYSNLFTALEELKAAYPSLVEDYSVTETTLEEVFLSFAKEQHQRAQTEEAARRNHVV